MLNIVMGSHQAGMAWQMETSRQSESNWVLFQTMGQAIRFAAFSSGQLYNYYFVCLIIILNFRYGDIWEAESEVSNLPSDQSVETLEILDLKDTEQITGVQGGTIHNRFKLSFRTNKNRVWGPWGASQRGKDFLLGDTSWITNASPHVEGLHFHLAYISVNKESMENCRQLRFHWQISD